MSPSLPGTAKAISSRQVSRYFGDSYIFLARFSILRASTTSHNILIISNPHLIRTTSSFKMASPSKAGFPKFVDGDVLVIVSTTQYYKLHSQVLTTHSPWFAEQLAAKPPPRLNPQARRENAAAFRFELHRAPGEEGPGQFIRIV